MAVSSVVPWAKASTGVMVNVVGTEITERRELLIAEAAAVPSSTCGGPVVLAVPERLAVNSGCSGLFGKFSGWPVRVEVPSLGLVWFRSK